MPQQRMRCKHGCRDPIQNVKQRTGMNTNTRTQSHKHINWFRSAAAVRCSYLLRCVLIEISYVFMYIAYICLSTFKFQLRRTFHSSHNSLFANCLFKELNSTTVACESIVLIGQNETDQFSAFSMSFSMLRKMISRILIERNQATKKCFSTRLYNNNWAQPQFFGTFPFVSPYLSDWNGTAIFGRDEIKVFSRFIAKCRFLFFRGGKSAFMQHFCFACVNVYCYAS